MHSCLKRAVGRSIAVKAGGRQGHLRSTSFLFMLDADSIMREPNLYSSGETQNIVNTLDPAGLFGLDRRFSSFTPYAAKNADDYCVAAVPTVVGLRIHKGKTGS